MRGSYILVGLIWLALGTFVVPHGTWHIIFDVIGIIMVVGGIFG